MKRIAYCLGALALIATGALAFTAGNAGAVLQPPTLDAWSDLGLLGFGLGGLIVNSANLTTLTTGFKTAFNNGLGQAEAQWSRVATEVPSSTAEEKYGWLGKVPNIREWIGERVVQNLEAHDYAIRNKKFEMTLGVGADEIKDDQHGVYAPLFTEMGLAVGAHPDQLVWALLKAGFSTTCYDGQYFFDTDHPVLNAAGQPVSVANTDGGGGTPWFLIDDSRALKPILYQVREPFDFVAMTDPTDEKVFNTDEFRYGVKGRSNVGFGFWQFAWGSKQTLDAAHYATARAGLSGMLGDHGKPLGVMPKLLVVPPALESAGRKIVNSEYGAGGETNEWKGTAELLVVPWLA